MLRDSKTGCRAYQNNSIRKLLFMEADSKINLSAMESTFATGKIIWQKWLFHFGFDDQKTGLFKLNSIYILLSIFSNLQFYFSIFP